MSWNVNGLSRKISDPYCLHVLNEYDVIFLQAAWLSEANCLNLDIEGYLSDHIYDNKSQNTNKGRGISIYYKYNLKNRIKVLNKNRHGILWIKLDSDLFEFRENVYFCNVYNVPQTSTVIYQGNFDFFKELESDIEVYKPLGKIFILGDMNSRISNLSNELDFDHYVDNDDSFISDSIKLPPRKNCNNKIDNNGRHLIDLCKATSLTIGNGRLHNDSNIGDFHFIPTMGRVRSIIYY